MNRKTPLYPHILLKNSMMKKVYIHPDQTRSERLQHANLRALVMPSTEGMAKLQFVGIA